MPKVISFSVEALARHEPGAVGRFIGQVSDACADALDENEDGITYLIADGIAVAMIVPLLPEDG